jgi:hypothetical protein
MVLLRNLVVKEGKLWYNQLICASHIKFQIWFCNSQCDKKSRPKYKILNEYFIVGAKLGKSSTNIYLCTCSKPFYRAPSSRGEESPGSKEHRASEREGICEGRERQRKITAPIPSTREGEG